MVIHSWDISHLTDSAVLNTVTMAGYGGKEPDVNYQHDFIKAH